MPPPKIAKNMSLLFAMVFLLAALAGFLPNPVFGAEGYFKTDLPFSALLGVAGLLLLIVSSQGESMAALGMWGVAAVLILIAGMGYKQVVLGSYTDRVFGLMQFSEADMWLCLGLAAALGISGFLNTGSKQVIRE
jgi:hypothetical protein